MNIEFKYQLEQRVTTQFDETGIIKMCAIDETGINYFVKTAGGGNWFKEGELTA